MSQLTANDVLVRIQKGESLTKAELSVLDLHGQCLDNGDFNH